MVDHPEVATFPKHFHDGQEDNMRVSSIPDDAMREEEGF